MARLLRSLSLTPSRRLVLSVLAFLLVFSLFFGSLRQRLYGRQQLHTYLSFHPTNPHFDSVTSISQNTFEHTEFYHHLKKRDDEDYCAGVSQADIADLVQSMRRPINNTLPLVYHFQNDSLITPGRNEFPVGSGFCSIVMVPQMPYKEEKDRYRNPPIEGFGPDQIHAEIAAPDVRLMITEHAEYWGMVTTNNGFWRSKMDLAIYAVPYNLYQPGVYWFKGEIEYQHYNWAMEDPIDFRFVDHKYDMVQYTISQVSPPISVAGAPIARPKQPCFRDGAEDLRGRWFRADAFNEFGNMTALNKDSMIPFSERMQLRDGWGWTFAPDRCSLDYFSAPDHVECLRNKMIHVTGDSNSRRMLKSLIGGGEHWCPGEDLEDRWCQCEDYLQFDVTDASLKQFEFSGMQAQSDNKLEPLRWGDGTKTYFDMVGGVVNAVMLNGWSAYYSGNRNVSDNSTNEPLSIAVQRQIQHGEADIVYMSLVTWDIAAMRTPAETLAFLPELREKVFGSFPDTTRFVFRLGNGVCCGNTNHRTRFSHPRFMMWNALWREFFADDVRIGKVKFIDPSVLQGRRETETEIHCATSHLRVSHVRLEQMMWMNMVCEHAMEEVPRPKPSIAEHSISRLTANGSLLANVTLSRPHTFQNGTSSLTRPTSALRTGPTGSPAYTPVVRLRDWHKST